MNITKKLKDIYTFLMVDIWSIGKGDVSKMRFLFYSILKKLLLAIEFTTTKRITSAAAALTYSTLLAIVPIFAVVFGIARGFGYNKYIEEWFRESFSSQPQVSEIIIGFVNSYLVHTKSGLFLGIGLLFMLFTVIMLISNIERTFNDIWQAKKPRSMFRTITDYTSMLLLMPVVIVITSGISIFFATIFKQIEDTMVIGSLAQFFLQLLPYVLMSGVFIALYLFMPNTKVKLSCALVPGILMRRSHAGTAALLHPLADLGEQLQRHLRLVCSSAVVHALDTDFVVDMPVRRRTMLRQSEHGRLCVQG